MNRPRAAGSAGLAVLTLALTGCGLHSPAAGTSAPSTSPPPAVTAPVTTAPVTATPTVDPSAVFAVTPRAGGSNGVPAGGLPPASTRTSPNPAVVAAAAVRATLSSDTTLDSGPVDAEKRALPWLGGCLAAQVALAAPVAAPGAQWNLWAAHRAHTVVHIAPTDDTRPSDTSTTAYGQWVVTQTPVGDAGWTGPPVQTVVYTITTRTPPDGRWAVTTLQEAL
jgi:hypothetical protein